jgi:hypothetical protein
MAAFWLPCRWQAWRQVSSSLAKEHSSSYTLPVNRTTNSAAGALETRRWSSVFGVLFGMTVFGCDDGKCIWAEVESVYRITLGKTETVRIAPSCGMDLGPTEGDSFELRTEGDVAEDAFCEIQGTASFPGLEVKGPGERGAYEEDPVVSVHARRVTIGDGCDGTAYAEITGHLGAPRLVRMFVPARANACTVGGRTIDLACADAWPVRIEDGKGRVLADLPR